MKVRAAIAAAKESGILILARTDCRPTQGIDEALARIEMYAREGADILFLDSPASHEEYRRGVEAAGGKPCFNVLSPGPGPIPTREEAIKLGIRIGTYPTIMLSPAIAAMLSGLKALNDGGAASELALPAAQHREILGYPAYDEAAKPYRLD